MRDAKFQAILRAASLDELKAIIVTASLGLNEVKERMPAGRGATEMAQAEMAIESAAREARCALALRAVMPAGDADKRRALECAVEETRAATRRADAAVLEAARAAGQAARGAPADPGGATPPAPSLERNVGRVRAANFQAEGEIPPEWARAFDSPAGSC